jgi:hypothetical protein
MSAVQGLQLPLERFEKSFGTGIVPTVPFLTSCSGVLMDSIHTNYHENFWHNTVPPRPRDEVLARLRKVVKALREANDLLKKAAVIFAQTESR